MVNAPVNTDNKSVYLYYHVVVRDQDCRKAIIFFPWLAWLQWWSYLNCQCWSMIKPRKTKADDLETTRVPKSVCISSGVDMRIKSWTVITTDRYAVNKWSVWVNLIVATEQLKYTVSLLINSGSVDGMESLNPYPRCTGIYKIHRYYRTNVPMVCKNRKLTYIVNEALNSWMNNDKTSFVNKATWSRKGSLHT